MRVNNDLLFWGLALITAGAVALAIQAGLLPRELLRDVWQWWPLILIGIGVAMLVSRTPFALLGTVAAALVIGVFAGGVLGGSGFRFGDCGDETLKESVARDGAFDALIAQVSLDFHCGDLSVATGTGQGWTLDARRSGGPAPDVSADGSSLDIDADGGGPFGFGGDREEWELVLPADVTLELEVDANAATSELDLSGARLAQLELNASAGEVAILLGGAEASGVSIEVNAGSVSIQADASTRLGGSIAANAGSIELCAAEDAELAITVEEGNVTFSHDLDESGLRREGDTWLSDGANAGAASITLSVEGNASSFDLHRMEVCP
ncbi:MAG: LiaI-LiaF-like domain-containing protein [Candidatus Limnocylindria bacterium]